MRRSGLSLPASPSAPHSPPLYHELPSSSPSSSLPVCFATWWKVFIVGSLRPGPLSLSLSLSLSPPPSRDSSFFRQARSADGRAKGAPRGIGPYRPLLARLRKAPTRLRERRFDKDRTERTGGKQPECICLEGADYSLPKEFYLAISGLRSALAEQQTSEDHFSSYLRCIGPSMTHEWRGTNRFAPTLSRLDRLCVYKLMIVRVYSCYIELTVSVTICDA